MMGCPLLDSEYAARQNGKRLPCDELAWKNAKLRELVRHLYECTRHNVCVLCVYADVACDFEYEMRELGVEP